MKNNRAVTPSRLFFISQMSAPSLLSSCCLFEKIGETILPLSAPSVSRHRPLEVASVKTPGHRVRNGAAFHPCTEAGKYTHVPCWARGKRFAEHAAVPHQHKARLARLRTLIDDLESSGKSARKVRADPTARFDLGRGELRAAQCA